MPLIIADHGHTRGISSTSVNSLLLNVTLYCPVDWLHLKTKLLTSADLFIDLFIYLFLVLFDYYYYYYYYYLFYFVLFLERSKMLSIE